MSMPLGRCMVFLHFTKQALRNLFLASSGRGDVLEIGPLLVLLRADSTSVNWGGCDDDRKGGRQRQDLG